MSVRIIPRLDIKGPNLVKGVHLEGLRVLGKPERFARHYYEQGADELFYMDAVASLYERNSLLDIIERTAREIFIPLTVGGGLRSTEDINQALRAGADKVAINTAAIARPELISEAAERFGSSTIVVSIEAMKNPDGTYEAFTDFGRQSTGVDAIAWARRAEELGAGELVVISIDREGTGEGYDLELTGRISRSVGIPVIALGGAGGVDHVREVIDQGAADAVSLASLLHYNFIKCADCLDEDYSAEGNLTFLRGRANGFNKIADATLGQVKRHLLAHGVQCRWEEGWAA
ncbi:MAG: imidazole glycerol phosphate synthase cyclase subunit [Pseudomonadota bacterium]